MEKQSPQIPIPETDGLTVGDFWSWAYSDILSNRNRGIFAEFLVGSALDAVDGFRVEWDNYDITYNERGIEVKSSAYLQSWYQESLSTIQFDIAERRTFDYERNVRRKASTRLAGCYVFCVYAQIDQERADVLDIPNWDFYVLSTARLTEAFGGQKSVSLNPLGKVCKPVKYAGIRQAVDSALSEAE